MSLRTGKNEVLILVNFEPANDQTKNTHEIKGMGEWAGL